MALRIAVIDDDEGLRQSLTDMLKSLGYAVNQFACAEQFLDWAITHEVACIVSDVKMPGITGDELQARLITQGHRIPMIFLTAYPQDSVKSRVLAAGAFGFLTKPFQQQNFIDCLMRALATTPSNPYAGIDSSARLGRVS
jgi:FixJ family two-component response regulator